MCTGGEAVLLPDFETRDGQYVEIGPGVEMPEEEGCSGARGATRIWLCALDNETVNSF